jgi:REP element-mobilizing transposase RayT
MIIPFEPDKMYHIYNHANGSDLLFHSEDNYFQFLKYYSELLAPILDTYAYCLMPNHFHWLVKIKSEKEIFDFLRTSGKIADDVGFNEFKQIKVQIPNQPENIFSIHLSKQFANFFNTYTQSLNKQLKRKGNLFGQSFHRKEVADHLHAKENILQVHCNPVHHKYTHSIEEWKFSSFKAHLSDKPTMIKRKEVIDLFDTRENFISCHNEKLEKIKSAPFKEEFI